MTYDAVSEFDALNALKAYDAVTNGIEPLNPQFAATALPDLADEKYIDAVYALSACIFEGIITSSLLSKIVNTGNCSPKLCANDQVVAGVVWTNIALDPVIINPGIDKDAVPLVTVAVTPPPTKLKYDAEPWLTPSSITYIVPPPLPPFKAYEAVMAYDAVPCNEPVIPLATVREYKLASEPDTMTFFQFGIL